jgi:hypothetical protein
MNQGEGETVRIRAASSRQTSLHHRAWQFAAFLVVLFLILALPASGQDAASQIRTETERLQKSVKEKPISSVPGFPGLESAVGDKLRAADQELQSGRLYLSLEDLGQATDYLQAARTVAEKTDAVKGGLPAYEAEWEKVSLDLTAREREVRERNWSDSPVAIRALSETAQGQSVPLLEGARGFAVSTEPKAGLFNMGQAKGEAEFAAFCTTLHLPRKAAPYPLRSLLPEIETLQEKTNAAFQPPRSIDLHTLFMSLNSALKQAQELDATKSYSGALFQYLYAVGYYGMLDAAPQDSAQQSALRNALATARQKLDASQRDDSIAQFFLEKAESQVAHADGSAPSADDWRIAKVIVDQVLPAYFALAKPLAAQERASGRTIDITLVRWPYT